MKILTYIGIILFHMLGIRALAQITPQVRYYNQTSVNGYYGLGNVKRYVNGTEDLEKNREWSLEVNIVNGIRYKRHRFGIGTGADIWKSRWFIPLFGRYKFAFTDRKVSFCGSVDFGFAFGPRRLNFLKAYESNYFFFRPALGIQARLGPKISLVADVFYKLQTLRSVHDGKVVNPALAPLLGVAIPYTIYYNFIGVGVGIKI